MNESICDKIWVDYRNNIEIKYFKCIVIVKNLELGEFFPRKLIFITLNSGGKYTSVSSNFGKTCLCASF